MQFIAIIYPKLAYHEYLNPRSFPKNGNQKNVAFPLAQKNLKRVFQMVLKSSVKIT